MTWGSGYVGLSYQGSRSVYGSAAEAAVRDQDHVDRCREENTRMRAWLAESLAEKGVPSDTSTANFILARFADEAEANACDEYLQSQGLRCASRACVTRFSHRTDGSIAR